MAYRGSSDRPDTPEEVEEQRAITEAMMPLQLEAMRRLDEEPDETFTAWAKAVTRDSYGEFCSVHGEEFQDHDCDLMD